MDICIKEAKESAKRGDYPIGAVIIKNGKVLSTGRSIARKNNDPTLHAEIDAIRKAAGKKGSMHLEGCVLYTTLEPCAMCTAACVWAKLQGIVYGASLEDAINFANKIKDKTISLSYRQIKIKCRDVLEKAETKPELVEDFERRECIKLFELSK